MTFDWQIRTWPTVETFRAYLALRDSAACTWVQGLTIHHTAVPTVDQWHGRASMVGMGNFYQAKGWSAGPHLYIAPDGIWQGTPLALPGIHAIGANMTRWGIEIVGNYTHTAWVEPIRSMALGTFAALLDWRGLAVSPLTVDGHRNYNKPSCPGDAIDLDAVRAELAQGATTNDERRTTDVQITADSPIIGAPGATAEQCARYILSKAHGDYDAASISTIVASYFAVCASVGVDPLLAIAQMIHETGNLTSYWSQRPRRNPAGIGVNGQTGQGVWFASWEADAIPAHVGRLLAYAVAPRQANPAQVALISKALGYRSLPTNYRGVAPTLRLLGGRWAVPGTTYGAMIARVANAIVATVLV